MKRKVAISVRVFEEEKEELTKFAEADDQSVDRLVRTMVMAGLIERRSRDGESVLATMEFGE